MAPHAPTEPPSDEETPFASWDEFGRPLSDETNPPASGFRQGTHEHNISAHNSAVHPGLGGSCRRSAPRQVHAAALGKGAPAHTLKHGLGNNLLSSSALLVEQVYMPPDERRVRLRSGLVSFWSPTRAVRTCASAEGERPYHDCPL
ncbi:hypothetical protein AB1Y20_018986 [Prymnesium parvum]|uniref:Uncharacterized protein n=1 Tax=Prymnesium parvum TaxID=97485 RepID=A0AB34JQ83_PRYPA